jgi:hypothetical protein
VYIDVRISKNLAGFFHNFTTRCTAGSTRGYFELGNHFNSFAYGPLIEKWPEPEVIEIEFTANGSTEGVDEKIAILGILRLIRPYLNEICMD